MREFVICYTLENEIKQEKIITDRDIRKEEVLQEVLEKIKRRKYFNIKGKQGACRINTSLIRYVRVSCRGKEIVNNTNISFEPSK